MEFTLITITLLSTMLAIAMSVVAWRAARSERLRSEARIAVLAADIRSADADVPLPGSGEATSAGLFRSTQADPAASRLPAVILAGALVVGTAAALVVVSGSRSRTAGGSVNLGTNVNAAHRLPTREANDAVAPPFSKPLELVALGHERHSDSLTVRGVIRNPAGGTPLSRLAAVVLLFNREGGFLATGRAALQESTLGPGAETTFVVTVPGVSDVGRYRVSFRTDDRVVPHVDTRTE